MLAELVRTDRAHQRPLTGDSDDAEQVKVLAPVPSVINLGPAAAAQCAALKSARILSGRLQYRLADRDAVAVLAAAPGPEPARKLYPSKFQTLLRKAGRRRYLQSRAEEIITALRSEQLGARAGIESAYTATTRAWVAVLAKLNTQIQALERQVDHSRDEGPSRARDWLQVFFDVRDAKGKLQAAWGSKNSCGTCCERAHSPTPPPRKTSWPDSSSVPASRKRTALAHDPALMERNQAMVVT